MTGGFPVVLVPGFGSSSYQESDSNAGRDAGPRLGKQYWSQLAHVDSENNPLICVWPSGYTSAESRAREIFYQLKGGVVDYGKEHSERFGHERFGKKYRAKCPDWSADRPIHIIAHSLGGLTVRKLQKLLDDNAFDGYETSADWIVSVTTIGTPHNGTLLANGAGVHNSGRVAKGSPGWLLLCMVHTFAFWKVSWFYDVGMDQYKMSVFDTSISRAMRYFWGMAPSPAESQASVAYETTIEGAKQFNSEVGSGFPGTYYISVTQDGSEARKLKITEFATLSPLSRSLLVIQEFLVFILVSFFLSVLSLLLLCTRRRALQSQGAGVPVQEWVAQHDGVVPVGSQSHPWIGLETPAAKADLPEELEHLKPGVWYVEKTGKDHLGICPLPSGMDQANFLQKHLARLQQIEEQVVRSSRRSASGYSSHSELSESAVSLADTVDETDDTWELVWDDASTSPIKACFGNE